MSNTLRTSACLAVLLALAAAAPAQTFLVVTRETMEQQLAPRPLFSQEGFMAAMFDLGYVSFDTGPYEPEVDWENGRYREPLDIAAAGLADYVVVARIDTRLEELAEAAASGARRQLSSRVRFELLEVPGGRCLGRGELSLSAPQAGDGPTPRDEQPGSDRPPPGSTQPADRKPPFGYRQALLRAGEILARECLRLLAEAGPRS